MFSKRTALLLFSVAVILTLIGAQCGAAPTPEVIVETVVVEKEVEGEPVTVVETVEVIKEVEAKIRCVDDGIDGEQGSDWSMEAEPKGRKSGQSGDRKSAKQERKSSIAEAEE